MALIQCVECGNDVSTDAVVCPNCGTPVKPQQTTQKGEGLFLRSISTGYGIILFIIVVLIALIIVFMVSGQ